MRELYQSFIYARMKSVLNRFPEWAKVELDLTSPEKINQRAREAAYGEGRS